MASGQSYDVLSSLIRRETVRLVLLVAVAVAAFALTRAVAEHNREMHLAAAAEWYERGRQAWTDGRHVDAVEAFRRASIRDRDDKEYALALGRALARTGETAAAARTLLAMRENAPEDPDINLELARLAAARDDAAAAVRYYYNALYAPWTTPEQPRAIRFELIDFLLAHDDRARAHSELLALTTDLPDDAANHLHVGRLFMEAGSLSRALEQFTRALALDEGNPDALAGAGVAAFELGDYTAARRYFRALPEERDDVGQRPEIANLVLSADPLAPRLGAAERRRRLADGLTYARQRLADCVAQIGGEPSAVHAQFEEEAEAFEERLRPSAVRDADTLEAGLDLIRRIVTEALNACGGTATPRDEALRLIGRRYGVPAA